MPAFHTMSPPTKKSNISLLDTFAASAFAACFMRVSKRCTKMQEISEATSMARLVLHKKKQQYRTTAIQSSQKLQRDNNQNTEASKIQQILLWMIDLFHKKPIHPLSTRPKIHIMKVPPKVGDEVYVPSLGMKVRVLKVETIQG